MTILLFGSLVFFATKYNFREFWISYLRVIRFSQIFIRGFSGLSKFLSGFAGFATPPPPQKKTPSIRFSTVIWWKFKYFKTDCHIKKQIDIYKTHVLRKVQLSLTPGSGCSTLQRIFSSVKIAKLTLFVDPHFILSWRYISQPFYNCSLWNMFIFLGKFGLNL